MHSSWVRSSLRVLILVRTGLGRHEMRKLKGVANVQLPSGRIRIAEIHWYDAHGVGK